MDLSTAIKVIESVAGFTDPDTAVGEAWATVLSRLNAAPAPATRRFINNPVQIAECGGPCADGGPEACDCGALWCDAPPPAPAGDVAELAQELRRICFDVAPCDSDTITRVAELLRHQAADVDALRGRLSRAISLLSADLLERQGAPVPVAVSERLPGPDDCDARGRYWGLINGCEAWVLGLGGPGTLSITHWLPFNALPLPTTTPAGQEGA